MVNIKLTVMEAQEIKLWAYYNKEKQEECGLVWESQQQKIIDKINKALKKGDG